MNELISKEMVRRIIDSPRNKEQMLRMLESIPPAQPKRGKWVEHKSTGYLMCDQCKDVYINPERLADAHWNFCPNCGADMRGEEHLKPK